MAQILIADDEKSVLEGLALVLKDFSPQTAINKEQAIRILKECAIDVFICDLYFPNLEDGLSLIKGAKEISPETFIVVLTGYGSIETAVLAIKSGGDDFLTKRIPPEELKIKIANFIKIAQERRQLEQFKTFSQTITESKIGLELIGESPIIYEIKKKIERAGKDGKVCVLISGETGTGKEVCARLIHNLSTRKSFPFLPLDCPSIPENLFESELFGYEKGAFTDAKQRKYGKIELAHKGTLFLDEIADLPLNLQPKLLRFLETGEFFRLGGTRQINVDTRIIASTNQNLEELVQARKFREDLFYRLKVFVIELPPLRKRKEDIPLLVEYFLKNFDPLSKKSHKISSKLMNSFMEYDWPGNIRELRNIIECLLMSESEEEIIKMFSRSLFPSAAKEADKGDNKPSLCRDFSLAKSSGWIYSATYREAKKEAIQQFEKEYFTTILQSEDWNITRTAKKIGISREELHRKIRRLNIKPIDNG